MRVRFPIAFVMGLTLSFIGFMILAFAQVPEDKVLADKVFSSIGFMTLFGLAMLGFSIEAKSK